uniref:TSA: Wollemia nobilis Ref_Wollemi_Transcript_781_3450 transcribed RNA sequence n=1 Tax=Wollemia nobilis TaxID=56998 RepID=A0A0C9S9I1_9CONI
MARPAQFGRGGPEVSRRKACSALPFMSSFLQEASSGSMLSQFWFSYLLILLWATFLNVTKGSGSSALFLHEKPIERSLRPIVASTRGHGHENAPTPIHSPNEHLAVTPVSSSLPLPTFHHSTAQSPSSTHVSYENHIMRYHVKSHFLAPFLAPKSRRVKFHSHASSSLATSSAHGRELSAPVSDVLEPLALTSVLPPSIHTSIASNSTPPSLSPHSTGCCKSDMMQRPGSHNCSCVYPIKLRLLILNVSISFQNWSAEFQQELASQLGLSVAQFDLTSFYLDNKYELNISMDIAPLTGVSFPYRQARQINNTLFRHKLQLNSSLFGGYRLLNFTWVEPPALPPAVPVPAPVISPRVPSPTPPSAHQNVVHEHRRKRPSLVLVVGIAAGIVLIIFVFVLIICKCTSKREEGTGDVLKGKAISLPARSIRIDSSVPHPSSTRSFTYEELKEATNNFETASVLGEGGFGRVFKGVLKDGTEVAIKKLSTGGHQGDREFLVEVEMLSRLHHRNLVKLIGYYGSHDSSQQLLCYELVPNGSLEAWLHGPLGANHPLDWETRMKIALDAARGLAYLHEDSQPCVIHRDFKASNILLENNFHAKVADFGLAKHAPEGQANHLSTRVMGTFGYVAPEYAMTGHLLVKSDVYSYGVVLLELLTGRKPVDMSQPSGMENLVTWARPILRDRDRLEEIADPRLGGKYPKEDFIQVCAIAAACVAPEAGQRPTMGEVVQSLKMVQRTNEYHQSGSTLTDSSHPQTSSGHNTKHVSTTFESDVSSSIFSSGAFSGLSGIDNDNLSRTAVFSEDLQEGR